jgi:signal transduction histidine kinase
MDWARAARVADAVVVAVLVVSGQLSVWTASSGPLAEDRTVQAALLAVITVPLFVRRYRPLPVLLLVAGATWVQFELGGGVFQSWFAVLLCLYAIAAHAVRWQALVGAAVVTATTLAVDVPKLAAGDPVDEVLPAWFVLAGTWGLGRWIRHRRRETEALETRAAVAERDSAEQAARAVADERARIARELHDLVAHSMGVIVIQSQAGQRALDGRPDLARSALTSIENAGRQGLAEMRRLLGLLTGTGEGAVTPQPSLQGLDELVDSVRAAGLRVDVCVDGDVGSLPAGVDLAAYRIVQEALTNVLKHAAAEAVQVVVRVGGGTVDVEVCDDGRGATVPGRGHGLVGMRERAALYGGTVETGGLPGGGYRVRARLAVDGVSA